MTKTPEDTMNQTEMAAHDKMTWDLYTKAMNAGGRRNQAEDFRDRCAAAAEAGKYLGHNLPMAEEKLAEAYAAEVAAKTALDAHEESYTGWSRFWCVPAGHIHATRNCSTCNHNGNSTKFYLAHEVSGMDEAAAVAAQGPVLCTVCFPTAPIGWTNGLDEAKKAKQAAQCPGSGKYLNDKLPKRTGYYSGNWATCESCGGHITITSTGKLRAHKPESK